MSTAPSVLIPLAPGFEEIEAVTMIDVLRRADIRVVTAALGNLAVGGAHGITVQADVRLDEVRAADFQMIALPGGLPGATHLRDDPRVTRLCKEIHQAGGHAAAICAAPIALGAAGLTAKRRITCYPGFEKDIPLGSHSEERVVEDQRVLTSRGPGTAIEFSLAIVRILKGQATADALAKGMIVAAG
ncbi:MAG TPA: DJ-1/PfpI family protein [Planctomycetota bacterium]|jgi:4-methyl-5(b-hydroxyethyl)-thiazole monophosphate biosynthesis|nr:DJ-1/PfpI family protein [Planctomycetota bacterium]